MHKTFRYVSALCKELNGAKGDYDFQGNGVKNLVHMLNKLTIIEIISFDKFIVGLGNFKFSRQSNQLK